MKSFSRRWENLLTLLGFLAVIALPLAQQLSSSSQIVNNTEKRKMAEFPSWSWQAGKLQKYPEAFSAYYNDHFGFRAELLRLGSFIKENWLGASPSSMFTLGKNGWMFYNGNESLSDFRGLKKLSEADLKAWRKWLENRQTWLQARGIHYLFVVAPNKQSIYSEFMPRKFTHRYGPTILDQLLEYLSKTKCDVPVLDLRKSLQRAKSEMQVYHKLDTHWTEQGAFVGCQEIIKRVSCWYPELIPPAAERRFVSFDPNFQSDMLGYKGQMQKSLKDNVPIYSLPPGETQDLAKFVLPNFNQDPINQPFTVKPSKPLSTLRAVILRDSFATALYKPLSRHFASTTFVWRGPTTKFEADLANVVKSERADIFVEILVERQIIVVPVKKKCFGRVSAED